MIKGEGFALGHVSSVGEEARASVPSRARRVRVLGTGVGVPSERLASSDIDARLGLPPGTVERRTGVRRRSVETRRSAAALGAEAARSALAAANLGLRSIDCLIAASGTQDQGMPCNAALVHRELGLGSIPAFDVGASCLGFLAALDVASCLIDAGRYRRILIVSADIASCGLDWSRLEASGIFGDGAAAAVVAGADDSTSAVLATAFAMHSDGAHLCEIPGGGSRYHPSRISEPFLPLARFRMDGPGVFRMAAERLPAFVDDLLRDAGVTLGELALVIPHQASDHGLRWLRQRFDLPPRRVVDIFAEHGNQVAASLPSALHTAIEDGRLRRGDRALLIGTGAGISIGGAVLCF